MTTLNRKERWYAKKIAWNAFKEKNLMLSKFTKESVKFEIEEDFGPERNVKKGMLTEVVRVRIKHKEKELYKLDIPTFLIRPGSVLSKKWQKGGTERAIKRIQEYLIK